MDSYLVVSLPLCNMEDFLATLSGTGFHAISNMILPFHLLYIYNHMIYFDYHIMIQIIIIILLFIYIYISISV